DFRKNPAPSIHNVKPEGSYSTIPPHNYTHTHTHTHMYFLRQLKKFNLPKTMMVHLYTCFIKSILPSASTVWYAAATANDKGRLQRIIRSAEKVIGCNLPSLQDLFASRTLRRAGKIVADPSHPGHKLFEVLPSGRRLRSIRT